MLVPTLNFNAANPHLNFLGKPFHASELAAKVREGAVEAAIRRSAEREGVKPGRDEEQGGRKGKGTDGTPRPGIGVRVDQGLRVTS